MDPDLDGVLDVLEIEGDDVRIAIVNPDGSLAEMSGNGTRIEQYVLGRRSYCSMRVPLPDISASEPSGLTIATRTSSPSTSSTCMTPSSPASIVYSSDSATR